MKYVITGGAGHISKPIVERLLSEGHEVTVIGRNAANLKELANKGAKPAIGSVEDVQFLSKVFQGADGVYTMVPPNFGASDWKAYIAQIGKNYSEAINSAGVKYVVNLSSIGADLPEGCGPVSGLFQVEQSLNELDQVNIVHLRPGYFFTNFLSSIPMVKGLNFLGSNISTPDHKVILADTNDIAEVAVDYLLNLDFKSHTVRYIASDERTPADIASILGSAIGKPGLPYVEFNDADTFNGLQQAGLPEEVAKNYTEMGQAMRTGAMVKDYWRHHPHQLGHRKLEDFANDFAQAYSAN